MVGNSFWKWLSCPRFLGGHGLQAAPVSQLSPLTGKGSGVFIYQECVKGANSLCESERYENKENFRWIEELLLASGNKCCVYIYTHTHTHIYIICTSIYIMYICIHVQICICMYIYTYVCICMYVCCFLRTNGKILCTVLHIFL
jgi:hypothetical protein